MLTSDDYIVRLARFPAHVKAVTCIDETGFANVYINSQLSTEEKKAAIRHELKHIRRDDAFNALPIQTVEL